MKNKIIIAIITALICICTTIGVIQHFGSKAEENSNLILTDTSDEETDLNDTSEENETTLKETEGNAVSKEANRENTSKPEKTTEGNNAGTTTKKPETTTKQQTTEAPKTTKAQTTAKTTNKQRITVTVSINCQTALKYGADVPKSGYFYSPSKQTAESGTTAFDVLEQVCKDNGISLSYQRKTYIQEIGGLAEKDCGGASGWTYKVNGINPPKAASKYVLSDRDVVEWYYVTSPND